MQVLNALQMKSGKKAEYNRMGSITQPLQFLPKKEKTCITDYYTHIQDYVGSL